ncbi:MAG: NADH-quinone oxidoreductase subunit J [Nitrososphaerales archaeon]
MIIELLDVGLIISACLAIYLDEAVYSVASLACMFVLMAFLYALNDAVFVAVFQLAVGAGTLAVLFLAGEMLSAKPEKEKPSKKIFPAALLAIVLSLPSIFLSVTLGNVSPSFSFADTLWNLRVIDVILQGLAIMTVALGIVIAIHERRESES